MVTLEINLPEEMLVFLETQVKARGYANLSAYLEILIAQAQQAAEQSELESRFAQAVLALERGEPAHLSSNDWQKLRRLVAE